jgi:hypothetical protein
VGTCGLTDGEMRQYDKPDRAALENLLGSDELCAHFDYAGQGQHREVDVIRAIGAVFMDWKCGDPTPEERTALRSVLRKLLAAAD